MRKVVSALQKIKFWKRRLAKKKKNSSALPALKTATKKKESFQKSTFPRRTVYAYFFFWVEEYTNARATPTY